MKSPGEELLEIVDRLFQGVPKNRNQPYLKDLVRAQDLVRMLESQRGHERAPWDTEGTGPARGAGR